MHNSLQDKLQVTSIGLHKYSPHRLFCIFLRYNLEVTLIYHYKNQYRLQNQVQNKKKTNDINIPPHSCETPTFAQMQPLAIRFHIIS